MGQLTPQQLPFNHLLGTSWSIRSFRHGPSFIWQVVAVAMAVAVSHRRRHPMEIT